MKILLLDLESKEGKGMDIRFVKLTRRRKKDMETFFEKLTPEDKANWGISEEPEVLVDILFFKQKKEVKIIGIIGKEIVCYGQITPIRRRGYLEGIVVRSDLQRQGIGTLLVKKLEGIAKKEKLEIVDLEVFKNNSKAISFYKKMGYEVDGESKHYYKMQKKL